MGRPLRVVYADRLAHVMFHTLDLHRFTENDRHDFFVKLQILVQRHQIEVLGWVFMMNHVHLLIRFKETQNGGTLVGTIESCLTKLFNRNHRRKGSLWRGRYKDVTVSTVSHFWSVLFYIHLNKIKAGAVTSFEDDDDSSYRAYARGIEDNVTTLAEEYLELGDSPRECQKRLLDKALKKREEQTLLLRMALKKKKIPHWVVNLFFAYEAFITDFVEEHRDRYRYAGSKPKARATA